jgi:hypothetical protein
VAFSDGKTTIILGAGASSEAGLPVGRELKSQIERLLDIRYEDGYTRSSGSGEIDSALRLKAQAEGVRDINPYLRACWQVRDAMPQAISVDNYLDAHADDAPTVAVGKLGIAQAILEAERRSMLHIDRSAGREMVDFARMEDTWFNKFVQLLTENCRASDLPGSLSNVSVISFNYDRCFERFVYFALRNYYRMDEREAADLLSSLSIYHPYGLVGCLPWQRQQISTEFGETRRPRNLLEISSQIRTFTEGTDPETSNIELIRRAVADCDQLIFLGFAFHPMNMRLLSSTDNDSAPRASYGTALGLSDADVTIVEREIKGLAGQDIDTVELRNDLTCSALFDEYRRSFTSL